MVEVIISKLSGVPRDFVDFITEVLNSFYKSLGIGEGGPLFVEVLLHGSDRALLDFLLDEAAEAGVGVLGDYPVSHEAWRGWPRIHVDYAMCSKLSTEVLEALLVHEAAHSVIHGSRDYYLAQPSREILELLGPLYGLKAWYLASTVVKDLEVHEYLLERGYRRHVEQYAVHSIREAVGLGCEDLLDTLVLAKLVAPCVYVDCSNNLRSLINDCSRVLGKILSILAGLSELGESWVEKSEALVKIVAEVLPILK